MALRIAIIGGGSAYAPGVINAFINHKELFYDSELILMDIAPKELAIVSKLGQKLAKAADIPIKLSATQNQKQAITGADYVLSTFRQGGFEARHLDEAVPLIYDVIGQETIGPGGFFFAMRTLPVIQSILEDIKSSAPNAILINYTNPTQIVAEAVTHFSNVPCISICDQTKADQEALRSAMGIPEAKINLESVGLNHATWSTRFLIDNQDGIEVIRQNIKEVLGRDDVDARVKRQLRLADRFGRLPNSYLQYYYFREETLEEAKRKPKTRAQEILHALPKYYQHFQDQIKAEYPKLTQVRGGSIFGDMAVEVISSFVKNDGSIHTLNLPNCFAIPDFPPDRIVEVPARLETDRVQPLAQGHLPSEVVGLLHMLAEYQWLAAKSIMDGNRQALENALASNPLVLSLSLSKRLLDHMLPLLKPYIQKSFYSRWQ